MLFASTAARAVIGPSAAAVEGAVGVVGVGAVGGVVECRDVGPPAGAEDGGAAGFVADGRGCGVAFATSGVVGVAGAGFACCGVRCWTPAATARPPRPSTPTPARPASESLSHRACRRLRY